MAEHKQTPSQTVGPYFSIGLSPDRGSVPVLFDGEMATAGVAGRRIRVEGQLFDGAGDPISDAVLEVWQADAEGHHRSRERTLNDGFTGFGRVATNGEGGFVINTIMPGRVPGPGKAKQAPHLLLVVFMRGLLSHVFTRVYFEDMAAENAEDPILDLVPQERRPTLIARLRHNSGGEGIVYDFDIKMQGDDETVFFDV